MTQEVTIWREPLVPPVIIVAEIDGSWSPQMTADQPPPYQESASIARPPRATEGDAPSAAADTFRGLSYPSQLPAALLLEALGEGTWGPRRVIRARGEPRRDADNHIQVSDARNLTGVGVGATSYDSWVDAERGVIVSAHAHFEGDCFHVVQLMALAINE
jgi:hypothetical protein